MKHLLSPREVAAAIGVSESTLKRWTDDGLIRATRTAGGHRRIPINEAIRFVRESQARIVNPTILGLKDLEELDGETPVGPSAREEQVHQALVDGRASRVRGLVTSLFLDGVTVAELCDDVLAPCMQRIGEIWRHSDEGIFIEHRATDLCVQALNHLQGMIELPEDAAVAVGGGPSKDPYLLGTLMAATCLADAGIRAVNLGPDTPVASILHAVDASDAALAWLSVSAPAAPGLGDQVSDLADELDKRGGCLVVGGRNVSRSDLALRPNVHVGRNMRELVAFARGVLVTRHVRGGPAAENARASGSARPAGESDGVTAS